MGNYRTIWKTIRKFGLEHCDFPTMVWNVSVLLRCLTLNVDSRYRKKIPKAFYIATISVSLIYYYTYLLCMLWTVFIRCPQTGDLVTAMVVMSLGVSSEICVLKLFLMKRNVKKIRKMIDEYIECDSLTTPGSRYHINLMKTLRKVKKRAITFWTIIMLDSVAYCIAPAFISGRHLLEDLYVIYGLEPMFETPNFEIANVIMGTCVIFICFTTANITSFIIIVVGYTEAQLLCLSEELTHLWDDAIRQYYHTVDFKIEAIYPLFKNSKFEFDQDAKHFININIKKRLVEIITKHSRNVDLLRQVENVFKESLAVGFLLLVISLIAELLGGLSNTYLQVPFTLVQVAMDCFTGQKVMDASTTLEKAVYDCKWENFDRNNMKIVLLMLQNSQKTLTLSAGGMMLLNFSSLMSILKSVYSTYTTLRNMM